MSKLYVYGLVRHGAIAELETAAIEAPDAKIVSIPAGPLSALVSPIAVEEVISTRRNLLAHARALEEAMRIATVLPVRFGVIATDGDALARAAASQAERLTSLIDAMQGRAEFGVRVSWNRDIIMREIAEEAPHLAARREALAAQPEAATYYERIEIGREIAERLSAKRTFEEMRVFQILKRCADDSKLQAPEDDVQVMKADFLLTAAQEPGFYAAVEAIEAEAPGRLSVRYVGPAPTYNFVNVRLELDSPPAATAVAA